MEYDRREGNCLRTFQFLIRIDLPRITSILESSSKNSCVVPRLLLDDTTLEKKALRISFRRSSEDNPNLGSRKTASADNITSIASYISIQEKNQLTASSISKVEKFSL